MSIRVVTNDLTPAHHPHEYHLHCAALEWSLAEPIIINSAEDIKSRVDWKGRLEPYYHQVQNLMRFCRRLPVTLLADDVGLGKTISAGLIISELMKRSRISKVFVICPKILIPQWIEELDSKFGISAYGAVGGELRHANRRTESVIVTTYQSATGFLEQLQLGLFDMLILDEAHKVRNLYGSPNPPRMAKAIYKALEARMFKYVVMLTATPIQNRLWDIYSLIDCLAVARGHRNPLGSPDQFATRFIKDSRNSARELKPEHAEEFRGIVASYMFRTRRIDARLVFPDRQVQTYAVPPTREELSLQRLVAENISLFNALQQSSLLVALMSSPQALEAQLKTMASNGTAPPWLANEVAATCRGITTPAKAKAVLSIANDLRKQGSRWRMVIFTTRRETQRMLGTVLAREGIRFGYISGGEPTINRVSIEKFRKEEPEINVIVSTDAGAEGVNLQAANILVNYDLPWNPMIVEQRIGRVQRIGSKFKNVWVANIVHDKSPEQRIVARLMEKLQVISHTVGDIEAVLEASNDSNGDSFEKHIRQMVVAALQGQDQELAARRAEESLENARKLIEQNQEEMDRVLGSGKESDEADIPMPRLAPARPTMPLEDFVLAALKAEGCKINPAGEGLFTSISPTEGDAQFTFDVQVEQRYTQPGVFLGRTPLLYQPGKPAFERLVQRWVARSEAAITDQRTTKQKVEELANEWLAAFNGATFTGAQFSEHRETFVGTVICRVRVSNAVDSYEKLLRVTIGDNGEAPPGKTDLNGNIQVRRLISDIDARVQQAIEADSDIRQFKNYYEARLRTELARSDGGQRKEKLIHDLQPTILPVISAIEGKLTDSVTVDISYRLGGNETYRSTLHISGGTIVQQPEVQECEITHNALPVDCLARCAVTNKLVLRDKLEKSEANGDYALPDTLMTCAATGKRIHQGQAGTCSVSGLQVWRDLLFKSELSGRLALPQYGRTCDFTGTQLIEDELITSTLSGKKCRRDQAVVLANGKDVAHTSEATRCAFSNQWYANADCEVSDASQQPVAKSRLAYSELSGRKCDQSEIVACELSGRKLLSDEIGRCAVSEKLVAVDLLKTCPETGKAALEEHLTRCQASGQLVMPEAIHTCAVTGKRVRRSLMGISEASGKLCLLEHLVRCDVTGAFVLPDETGVCEVTGKRVDARQLSKCSVSGKTVLASQLVRSDLSGKWMLPTYTIKFPSGKVAGSHEVAICTWTQQYFPKEQVRTCVLCGLPFAKNQLNASGEFKLLRECLDGKHKGTPFPESGFLARVQPQYFSGVRSFQWISSPTGKDHILFGTKSTFGFNARVFAVLARGDLSGLALYERVLFGKRVKGVWQPLEQPVAASSQ